MTLTLEEFTYGFVKTFAPEAAAAAYERYAVPETGQIFYEAGFANFHLNPPSEVHFRNGERAPLLMVGAEKDNTVQPSSPGSSTRCPSARRRRPSTSSSRAVHTFSWTAEGWEEVAAAIDSWLDGVLEATVPPAPGASA